MENLVDVGIGSVENRIYLWDHAEHVYWHHALPNIIMLGYMTIRWYKFYFNIFADKLNFKITYYKWYTT